MHTFAPPFGDKPSLRLAVFMQTNQEIIRAIVNPSLDELEQLSQTTIIRDTCTDLLPKQRKEAKAVAQILYASAFEGETGKEFVHKDTTYQVSITRTYRYPKRSRNPETHAQLQSLHYMLERKAALQKEQKQLTKDIDNLKSKLNPKMKLESTEYGLSVRKGK